MTIAVVSDSIYPYNKGGKERRIFDITKQLAAEGHTVNIYTMKWWDGPSEKIEAGLHLHGVVPRKNLYTRGGRRSIRQAVYFGVKIFFPLLRSKFDVLEVDHMPYFQLFSCKIVALMKRKKMVASWNEVWGRKYWNTYLPIFGFFGYLVEQLSVRLPDVIVSISTLTTNRLVSMLGVKATRIETIPCGVDVEEIRQGNFDKTIDVIYYGRLLQHKNVDRLIQAVQLVSVNRPHVSCLIIGNGPERGALERLVDRAGLGRQVTFQDFLPRQEQLYEVLRHARVFASLSTREGFGIAVLEANAAGLPVVIADHPENAARDFIADGREGFVCPLDTRVIAARLETILDNDKLREHMGTAGVENARRFSPQTVAKNVASVYEKLVVKPELAH